MGFSETTLISKCFVSVAFHCKNLFNTLSGLGSENVSHKRLQSPPPPSHLELYVECKIDQSKLSKTKFEWHFNGARKPFDQSETEINQ